MSDLTVLPIGIASFIAHITLFSYHIEFNNTHFFEFFPHLLDTCKDINSLYMHLPCLTFIEGILCYLRKKQIERNNAKARLANSSASTFDKVFLKIQPSLSPIRQDATTAKSELSPKYNAYSRYFVPTFTIMLQKIFNAIKESDPLDEGTFI
jgi:hypothetical protein